MSQDYRRMLNLHQDKLGEECAVFGVSGADGEAAGYVYNGLLALQHRGQEGAGIVALKGSALDAVKGEGLVGDVFDATTLTKLEGSSMALGHTRYLATANPKRKAALQPFVTEYLVGRLAVAHNGVLTNGAKLKKSLEQCGLTFSCDSNSEIISKLIAYKITQSDGDADKGVLEAVKMLEGAFSLCVLTSQNKLYAARDVNGFRPLCIGSDFRTTAVASESCAIDGCGLKFDRDVSPGELVIIEGGKVTQSVFYRGDRSEMTGLCIFEYVYFARPDSVIDGLSVYEARFNMGVALAEEWPQDADVVCGVPDSGLEAALGYSYRSGTPLVTGFIKNRYVGRSFIYPSQIKREQVVKIKLNPLTANVKGKRVVLVDDSIVRGTTCARIIRALREAGAIEVHMRVSSPPFRHTCHYGTDIGDEKNLIANKLDIEQIRVKIGADSLGYISSRGLKLSCKQCKLGFCTYCFDKNYGRTGRGN